MRIAAAVAEVAILQGHAERATPEQALEQIEATFWEPGYAPA